MYRRFSSYARCSLHFLLKTRLNFFVISSSAISSRQQEGNFGSRTRKKRRRTKESKSPVSEDRAIAEDSRENEVSENERTQSSQRRNNVLSKSKNREARKSRAERRRRKKKNRRERNGSGRRSSWRYEKRQDVARRSSSKYKRKTRDDIAEFPRERLDFIQASSEDTIDKPSNVTLVDRDSRLTTDDTTVSSNLQDRSAMMDRSMGTMPRQNTYAADTVEKELSKQLEMEISRSVARNPAILDNASIFDGPAQRSTGERSASSMISTANENSRSDGELGDLGGSRYDAEKMLGYSRTEEDLPILDLENEVLERTLKDYNAYMTSRLKLMSSSRREELPAPLSTRHTSAVHPPRKPIINPEESEEAPDDDEDDDTGGNGSAEVTNETRATQDDGVKGDLSCINGTFLPAPLSRHALIKYVK